MISSTEFSSIASSDIGKLWIRRTIIKIIKAMANNAGIRCRKRPRVGRVANEIAKGKGEGKLPLTTRVPEKFYVFTILIIPNISATKLA